MRLCVPHVRTVVPVFRASTDRPHDYNATVDDDVVFRCDAYAVPDATIVWYKNGQEIYRMFNVLDLFFSHAML